MKKKYFFITILFGIFSFISTFAQTISREEAIIKAQVFLKDKFPLSRTVKVIEFEQVDFPAIDNLYLFNLSSGGFIIVSGETIDNCVLGYSVTGRLNEKSPDNLKWLIKGYEDDIVRYKNTKTFITRSVNATPIIRKAIEPLIKIKWSQGSPYNILCPTINGHNAVTGCVPTAMAQLMGYYQWPERGHGMLYHMQSNTNNGKKDSINLDATPIDWSHMKNTYKGSETQVQKEAVALLMKMCGYSCDASYGLSDTGASGNKPFDALLSYFYYKGVKKTRDYFCNDETAWFDFLYNSIYDKKPIIVSLNGIGGDSGHEVIIDGYDGLGYFHMNFGWNGYCDGYFSVHKIGNVGGYSFGRIDTAIVCEPDYDKVGQDPYAVGENEMAFIFVLTPNGGGGIMTTNYSDNNTAEDVYSNMLEGDRRNMEVGIKIIDPNGNPIELSLYKYDENGDVLTTDAYNGYYTKVDYMVKLVSELGFDKGKYRCFPICKKVYETKWNDVRITLNHSPACINMIVKDNGEIVFNSPDVKNINIKVEDKTIYVEDYTLNYDIHVFNTYGLRVYTGRDERIKVASPGIYTIRIGHEVKTFLIK